MVQKDDFTNDIDQYDAIEGTDCMVLDKNRPLAESKKTSFRAFSGQMGWVTRQSRTRPDGQCQCCQTGEGRDELE